MSDQKNSPLPDKIVFVNAATDEITDEIDFLEVPESIRLVPNADGEIEPVFNIIEFTDGVRRVINQIGRDGTVLKSTIQILDD